MAWCGCGWSGPIAIIIVTGLTILSPTSGRAAPPPADSEYFHALYRKTLEEFDKEANSDRAARNAFQQGLALLDKGEFDRARSQFAEAHASRPSYAAAFNEALSAQLAHSYRDANELYAKARRPDLPDPELETNDAIALALEGKDDDSAKAFDAAQAAAPDADVTGRVLYQRANIQLGNGQVLAAADSLRRADDAFDKAGDAHGRAVVAVARGTALVRLDGGGEQMVLDAIVQLRNMGALVDESDARLPLAAYYSALNEFPKAELHLVRAVAAAREAHHSQQTGRSLSALAAYRNRRGQRDDAIKSYQEAIAAFQMVRDRFGEGEAASRLGEISLESSDTHQAFKHFDDAVRAYRRARSPQAFVEALACAEVFRRSGQARQQKYFLDIARSLLGDHPAPAPQARFLVAQAHYDVSRDPDIAANEARQARDIFSPRGDANGVAIADLLLERADDVNSAALTRLMFVVLGLCALLATVIHFRTEVWDLIRGVANIIARPFRAVAGWYRRFDQWWTGRLLPDADEETRRADERRARMFRLLFLVTIVGALVFDALTVTLPNLHYVEQIRQIAASETKLAPPDVIDSLQGLLDRDWYYILFAAFVQIVILAVAYAVAVVFAISVDTLVFGSVQHLLRRAAPAIDDATRTQAAAELATRLRISSAILIAALAGTGALLRYDVLSVDSVGTLLPATLFLSEAGLSVLLYRRLGRLPDDQRRSAYAFVSRIGFHYVGTLFFGVLGFFWLILPSFYYLSRIAQMWLVLPTFNEVFEQFIPLLKEAVAKYGTFFLTGEVFVAFANLKSAYDPGNGVAEFWAALLELLPIGLWVWTVYLAWWLAVPLMRAGIGLLGAISVFLIALHEVITPALVLLFHLDEEKRLVSIVVALISITLMFVLEHTVMAAFGGHGQHPPHDQHPPPAAPPQRPPADPPEPPAVPPEPPPAAPPELPSAASSEPLPAAPPTT
jgi:tetratricopeptide (TPR) repeat protein